MPYFVSSIIAVVSAMIIMFTRYEADDSSITAELESVKSMFSTINGFVNTYIETGGDLTKVNFEVLFDAGILSGNIRQSDENATDKELDWKNRAFASVLNFPKSQVKWQLIPVRNITENDDNADFGDSAGSAYKLLVDMSANTSLMSKAIFSESFASGEFCEKMLFGTTLRTAKSYDSTSGKETFSMDGTDKDGIFVCVVFK